MIEEGVDQSFVDADAVACCLDGFVEHGDNPIIARVGSDRPSISQSWCFLMWPRISCKILFGSLANPLDIICSIPIHQDCSSV